MPLPKYFQELYEEFGELKDFDLKEVIYNKNTQEKFLKQVRLNIEHK